MVECFSRLGWKPTANKDSECSNLMCWVKFRAKLDIVNDNVTEMSTKAADSALF